MTIYTILIEEIISGEFEVQAESSEEALEIAREKYKSGEFVVDPEFPVSRQMAAIEPDGDQIEWEDI